MLQAFPRARSIFFTLLLATALSIPLPALANTIPADATSVTLDSDGNLVITDLVDKSDALTIRFDGGANVLIITDAIATITTSIPGSTGDGTNTVTIPIPAITGDSILATLLQGSDRLTILEDISGVVPYDVAVTAEGTLTLFGIALDNTDFSASAPTITVDSSIENLGPSSDGDIELRGSIVSVNNGVVSAARTLKILQPGDDVTGLTLSVPPTFGALAAGESITVGDNTDGGNVVIQSFGDSTPLDTPVTLQSRGTLTINGDINVSGLSAPTLTLRGNVVNVNAQVVGNNRLEVLQPGDDTTSLTLVATSPGRLFTSQALIIGDNTDGGDVTVDDLGDTPNPLDATVTVQTHGRLTLNDELIVDGFTNPTLTLRGNLVRVNRTVVARGTLRVLQPGDDATDMTLEVDTGFPGALVPLSTLVIGDNTDGGDVTITELGGTPVPISVPTTLQSRGILTVDDDVTVDDFSTTPSLTLRGNEVFVNRPLISRGPLRVLQPGDDTTPLNLTLANPTYLITLTHVEVGTIADAAKVSALTDIDVLAQNVPILARSGGSVSTRGLITGDQSLTIQAGEDGNGSDNKLFGPYLTTGTITIRGGTGNDILHLYVQSFPITPSVNAGDGFDDIHIHGDPNSNAAEAFTIAANLFEGPGISFDPVGGEVLIAKGQGGDDLLTVDFSAGNAVPTGGEVIFEGFDGGETIGDRLALTGGTFTSIAHTFLNAQDGSIDLDGSTVAYTGLEPVSDNLNATDRSFAFSDADDAVTLGDNGIAADGISRISSSSTSETVDFVNPSGSLTVQTGGGDDTLTHEGLDTVGAPTALVFDGNSDTNAFVLDDAAGSTGNAYSVSATALSRADLTASLASFASITVLGGTGEDTFTVTPSADATFTIAGNAPVVPPGDALDVEMVGITGETLTPSGPDAGTWSFGSGEQDVTYTGIETLLELADLALAKLVDFPEPYPGDAVTLELVLTNLGPDPATNVVVTDIITDGFMYVVGSENASEGTASYDGGTRTLTWSGIDLAAANTATLTFQVVVVAIAPGTLTNEAAIAAKDQGDPDLANNTAMTTVTVQEAMRFPANVQVQALAYWQDLIGNVHPIAGTYNFGLYRGIPENILSKRWVEANEGLPKPLLINDLVITLTNEIIAATWGQGGIWRSTDGGRTWTVGEFPGFGKGASSAPIVYALAEASDGTLYASADRGRYFRSEDGGNTWTHVGDMPVNSALTAWSLVVDPNAPNVVYAGTFGAGLYKSTDRGETFNPVTIDCLGPAPYLFDLEFDPEIAGQLWLGTAAGVFTVLNETVCTERSNGLDVFKEVRAIAFDADNALYAAIWGGGVYKLEQRFSNDDWVLLGLRGINVTTLALNPLDGMISAGTEDGGVVVLAPDGSDLATDVEAEPEPGEVPSGYSIAQNYPNPFNPFTTVQFDLPENTQVRLAVFDMLGREVAVLLDAPMMAGQHEVAFNAADLPSGLYLYRLQTPATTITKTMTLLK